MNPFDLKDLKEAANVHILQKANRAELRNTHHKARDAMFKKHEMERIYNPKSADIINKHQAEVVAQDRLFAEFETKQASRQETEWKAFEAKANLGNDSQIEYARNVRNLEIKHEKEIDSTTLRHEVARVKLKFENLDRYSNDPEALSIHRAGEQGLLNYQQVELDGKYAQHARAFRELDHRHNSERAQRLDAQRADRSQREAQAHQRAVEKNLPVVDPRVPATLAVVAAIKEHQRAEQAHLDGLAHQQEVSEPADQPKAQAPSQAASEPTAVERPAINEQQEFNRKVRETEVLAKDRNRQAGDFNESLENERSKAKVYSEMSGMDTGLDAAARARVEREWIPQEFAFAQGEIARREVALRQRLSKINSHLEPADKIRSGRAYTQIQGKDGELHDPSLADIERVADRLEVLAYAEERAREAEREHPEWMQAQQAQAEVDPRVEAMQGVKEQIEEHKQAEVEHQAAMKQPGAELDEAPTLEQLRDEKLAGFAVARDKALEAAAQSPYVKMQTKVANSEFDRQVATLDRDFQAAVKQRTEFEATEARPWRDAVIAVSEMQKEAAELDDKYRTDVRGMESDRDQELQEVQQAWDDKMSDVQDQQKLTDMNEDRDTELGEVKGEHQQLIDQRTRQFEQDKIAMEDRQRADSSERPAEVEQDDRSTQENRQAEQVAQDEQVRSEETRQVEQQQESVRTQQTEQTEVTQQTQQTEQEKTEQVEQKEVVAQADSQVEQQETSQPEPEPEPEPAPEPETPPPPAEQVKEEEEEEREA